MVEDVGAEERGGIEALGNRKDGMSKVKECLELTRYILCPASASCVPRQCANVDRKTCPEEGRKEVNRQGYIQGGW